MAGGKENLNPIRKGDLSPEELKKRQRNGGIKSGIAKREKKLMTQIYTEFLMKEHEIVGRDGKKKKLAGHALLSSVMSKVLSRGDSSAVSLMKEIREATEGNKTTLDVNGKSDFKIIFNPVKPDNTDEK